MGPDVSKWAWGRIHRLRLAHPLGAVKPLDQIFNGPEIGIGGDTDTPLQTAVVPHKPFGADAWAPSFRQIADLADLTRSVSVHPGGQSGHTKSKHWCDLFPLWARGEFHPQWHERAGIERHAEGILRLVPS